MNTRKIVFLTVDFPPIGGGISRYLYNIVRYFPVKNLKVLGLPSSGWQEFDQEQKFCIVRLGLPLEGMSHRIQTRCSFPFYLGRLRQEDNVSYILCGQSHIFLMLSAWIFMRLKKIPYGVCAHGNDLLTPQSRFYRHLFNYLLQNAKVVFVNSTPTSGIAKSLGVKSTKIHVVQPGIDTTTTISRITAENIKQHYGIIDKKCILTVGRLVVRKGHDIVIQALPKVLKAIPDLHYLIVGTGAHEESLKSLICNLGMEDHVTFAGFVPEEVLGAYYQACDVFVMVSREIPEKGDIEGFGIVYLEANLRGKPIVAGHSGGVTDAVVHGKTGLLVNPTDPNEVAESLVNLLTDKQLAEQLGKAGRERVLKNFSSVKTSQKVQTILSTEIENNS